MTGKNNIKRYYIIFHFRTHNSAYKGDTYTVYGKEGDKRYAKLCENGVPPHLYNSAKAAEKAAKNLISFCENVSEHYSIKEIEVENAKENGNFYIVFHYLDNSLPEIYGGGYYRYKGEKYAQFADKKDYAKIFKTRTAAINKAEWLLNKCCNVGVKYSIVDIDEPNTDIYTLQARAEEDNCLMLKKQTQAKEEAIEEPNEIVIAAKKETETKTNGGTKAVRLICCPRCGSTEGLYSENTEKIYFDYNGKAVSDEFIKGNEMCCRVCRQAVMTREEYDRMYYPYNPHRANKQF